MRTVSSSLAQLLSKTASVFSWNGLMTRIFSDFIGRCSMTFNKNTVATETRFCEIFLHNKNAYVRSIFH